MKACLVKQYPSPGLSPHNWRTTDEDEINRRRKRARDEAFRITNLDARHPLFSNFRVQSGSGLSYTVEIRNLAAGQHSCNCVDFRINGLGTCKHVEAVLLLLQRRHGRLFDVAQKQRSARLDVFPDPAAGTLRLVSNGHRLPGPLSREFDAHGRLLDNELEAALSRLKRLAERQLPVLRLSQEIEPWLEQRRRAAERVQLRREYELKVQSAEWWLSIRTLPPGENASLPYMPSCSIRETWIR